MPRKKRVTKRTSDVQVSEVDTTVPEIESPVEEPVVEKETTVEKVESVVEDVKTTIKDTVKSVKKAFSKETVEDVKKDVVIAKHSFEAWWGEVGLPSYKRGYSVQGLITKAKGAFGPQFDQTKYEKFTKSNKAATTEAQVKAIWDSQK